MITASVDAEGSIVSVIGGGSIKSSTSVTSDMRGTDKAVNSFYNDVEIQPPKGYELPDAYTIKIEIY